MSGAVPHWLAGRSALVVGGTAAASHVAAALHGHGARVHRGVDAPQADTASLDAAAIAAAFDAGPAASGFDILVHAGAPIIDAPADSINLGAWRAEHSADIDGRFLFSAEFVRRRLAQRRPGAILFLMPSAALRPGRAATLSAHGALDNLVKTLGVEWARDGVRVNAIASRVVEQPEAATEAQRHSLGQLASYLVSDYAAYVTGMIMGISEG